MRKQRLAGFVPKGWVCSTLGEIASYINGRAFKPEEWKPHGRPIIRIENLNNPNAKFNYSPETHEERYKVSYGDVLYAWSASLGAHIWRGEEAWLNQHIFRVIPNTCCSKHFIFYLLQQVTQELYNKSHGSGMVHVTKVKFEETEVFIPPLNDQARIVEKLDELFQELDAAIDRLNRINTNLKRYRASVLQAAVEGRLTAEWRKQNPPIETGAELLARILKERRAKWEENQLKKYAEQSRTPPKNWKDKYPEPIQPDTTGLPELPEGWVWASADQLSPDDISNGRSVNTASSGTKVLRLTAVRNGYIDLNKYKFGDWSEEEAAPFLINEGDLLIVRGNGSLSLVGRIGIVKTLVEPVAYPDTMIRLKVLGTMVSSSWFARFWDSKHVRKHLEQRARTSAGIYKISQPDILSVPIAIAPIREQKELVLGIENHNSIADSVETTIDSALQHATQLRQSILKRAFEGRLVPQDPNDEPASVLLERIRAERINQAATVKPTRKVRR